MANIGRVLTEARLERNLSIEQVAEYTRISPRFLVALEREEFYELPAPVYVRGFLRSYANFLGLDPQPLLEELAAIDPELAPPESHPPARPVVRAGASRDPFAPEAPARRPPQGDYYDEDPRARNAPPRIIDDFDPSHGREHQAAPIASGRPTRRYEQPLDDEDYEIAPGRTASGILLAREGHVGSRPAVDRSVMTIAGVAAVLVAIVIAVALFLRGGGDGDSGGATVSLPTESTPTERSAGGSSDTEQPAASPTAGEVTATPTPAQFVMPSYPSWECDANGGSCGDPIIVVCPPASAGAPDGFFVDIPGINDGYPAEWPRQTAASWDEALQVCR